MSRSAALASSVPTHSVEHEWTLLRPHPGQRRLRELMRRPDMRVLVAVLGRRWGKTTGVIGALIEEALRRPLYVGFFAHQNSAVRVAWEELCKRVPPSAIARLNETRHELHLIAPRSRFDFFTAENPDIALGRGFDLVVLDEAARMKRSTVEESIFPMTIDRGAPVVITTTPKGKKGRGSWVHQYYQRAKREESGFFALTGPSTENPLPTIREYVAFCQTNLPARVYEQEILARFLDEGGGVLDFTPVCVNGGSIDAPLSLPYEEEAGAETHIMGVDLAQTQDFAAACIFGVETHRLKYLDRWRGVAWETQIARIARLAESYRATVIIDATGVGAPVVERLRSVTPQRVIPVVFTNEIKQSLIQGTQVAIEQREFSMPYLGPLLDEADAFEVESLQSGRLRYAASEGATDDLVIAVALALHGMNGKRSSGLLTYLRAMLAPEPESATEKQTEKPVEEKMPTAEESINAQAEQRSLRR